MEALTNEELYEIEGGDWWDFDAALMYAYIVSLPL